MASKKQFERIIDGKQVSLFKLKNTMQSELYITNYGSRIVSLLVKDKDGQMTDVVVGFDSLDGYLKATEVYHGATIGRFANRIAKGKFHIDDKEYQLNVNNDPNHLHGGPNGFHTKIWDVDDVQENSVALSYISPDGEEDYPGKLHVKTRFTLSDENEVIIEYKATPDAETILNLTNHAYFNLNGQGNGPILKHLLQINAGFFTPVDKTLIPTGILEPVDRTPFDFRTAETIGSRINDDHIQLRYGNGYDHNYVINRKTDEITFTARVEADRSGIIMDVFTDQPGVQFYTGNFMSGENIIKGHVPDDFRTAFCLETQHFPDAPNQSQFPSTFLKPGKTFISSTIYKFSIKQ